ncbi:MAG: response regulator [Bacteroidota bacterium]
MKNIWIIDDDDIFQFVMKINISRILNDVDINFFSEGLSFLKTVELVKKNDEPCPNIIFLDINMPLMNGWEVIEKIKEMNCLDMHKTKLYLCSSSIDARDLEKAKSNNLITEYLLKPIDFDKLTYIVNN